ncbi:MAG: hypothetical protein ABJF10_23805 [Chthoniobacter sp.]|uniref:hypothetical protein n=1 Tax=Chthoniobacter sp. TaxID=2510640 RepID=UPI0032A58F5A
MREGWCNDDYWSMCEDQKEAEHLAVLYGLAEYLPGYFIVGLKGWDDFILCDREGRYFSVPTVPLERAKLAPFRFPETALPLESDERFAKKIKWYVKPILFGGDPTAEENRTWLSPDQHVQAVKWWNKVYYDMLAKRGAV